MSYVCLRDRLPTIGICVSSPEQGFIPLGELALSCYSTLYSYDTLRG